MPNLLGRLGVLDTCQLLADATMAETTFLPRWLDDPAQMAIWRRFTHMSEDIVERWKSRQRPSHVQEAVGSLLNRAGQLMGGIVGAVRLHRRPAVNPLLRSLFELSLQFEYLMRDSDARATRFLQFRKVTRYRWIQKWKQHPKSPISARLVGAGSALDHARVEQEFRQVESMFTSGRKSRLHDNWYGKKIRDLATELGRQAEYDLWYAVWSAWAHGDPFVVTVHDARHILHPDDLVPLVRAHAQRPRRRHGVNERAARVAEAA